MNVIDKNTISAYLSDKTGITITQFAENNNVSPRAIHYAIKGGGSRRIRIIIAKTVEMPPSILWSSNDTDVKVVDDLHYLGVIS
jgi:lambda repressor-like predicted transcriptional regulator